MLRVLLLAITAAAQSGGSWTVQTSPYNMTVVDPRDFVDEFDCGTHPGLIQVIYPTPGLTGQLRKFYAVTEFNLTGFTHDPIYKIDYDPFTTPHMGGSENKINSAAMYKDAVTGKHYSFAAFGEPNKQNADGSSGPRLCAFDDQRHVCLTTPLETNEGTFTTNFAAIIGSNYYYGHSAENAVYVVKGIDTAIPEIVPLAEQPLRFDVTLFDGDRGPADITVLPSSVVLDENGKTNSSLTYLYGLSPRGNSGNPGYDTVVCKVDASGMVVEYAILANVFDWGDHPDAPNGPSGGTAGFGGGYTFSPPGKAPRAFFSANNGWGLFEVDLPLTIPASCWNGGYQTTTGHAKCTTQGAHRLVWTMESANSENNDGMNCPETDIEIAPMPTALPTPAPSLAPLSAPTALPTTALPIPAPTLVPTTPYEEMNCNGTLHRYDGRAACCADMDSGALDAFLSGLTADSIKDACNAKGYGSP